MELWLKILTLLEKKHNIVFHDYRKHSTSKFCMKNVVHSHSKDRKSAIQKTKNKLHGKRQHQVLLQLLSQNYHCGSLILRTEIVTHLNKQFHEDFLKSLLNPMSKTKIPMRQLFQWTDNVDPFHSVSIYMLSTANEGFLSGLSILD